MLEVVLQEIFLRVICMVVWGGILAWTFRLIFKMSNARADIFGLATAAITGGLAMSLVFYTGAFTQIFMNAVGALIVWGIWTLLRRGRSVAPSKD